MFGSICGVITSSKLTKSLEGAPFHPKRATVELPVRVDFVGGWSDTPPWSLERPGCVLNMAINLEGSLPIRTVIETTEDFGILIEDDAENHVYVENPISISPPFNKEDPFRLVKSALHVTGIIYHKILSDAGLRIRTWANVPRGSGLGTSSILAAAVVKALLHLMEEDESNESVARIVLVLEQIMGTGGGWQDQIGGLYPGIKCTYSFPGQPLLLQVIPLVASQKLVMELEQRLLVVFTGQVCHCLLFYFSPELDLLFSFLIFCLLIFISSAIRHLLQPEQATSKNELSTSLFYQLDLLNHSPVPDKISFHNI